MALTRRAFLRNGAYGLTAVGAAGAGWQFRPTRDPDQTADRPLPGGDGPSLLVAYGSMMGSTGSQSAWMADAATQAGYRVRLSAVETAPAPDGFDAVILGSAIRTASWLDPVINWAAAHESALNSRLRGLFQCSMTCAGMIKGNRGAPLTFVQESELQLDSETLFSAAPSLSSMPVRFFPGRLDYRYLTRMLRIGYPFVSGSLMTGDYRRKASAKAWTTATIGAAS